MSTASQKAFKKMHQDLEKIESLNEELLPIAVIFYYKNGIVVSWSLHQKDEIEDEKEYIIECLKNNNRKYPISTQ